MSLSIKHINIGVSSQQHLFYWKARSMRVQPQLDCGYDQNTSNSRLSIKKSRTKSKYENKVKKFRSFIWNQSFLYKIKSNSFPNFTVTIQGMIKNRFENLNFHIPKQTAQNELQSKYICSLVLTDIKEICNKQKQEIIKYFIKDNKRVARLIFKASPNNSLDIKQGIFTPSLSLKPNNHWNFYKFRKQNKQLVFKTDKKTKIRTNRINTVLYCCGCIDFQNEEKKSESTGKNSC